MSCHSYSFVVLVKCFNLKTLSSDLSDNCWLWYDPCSMLGLLPHVFPNIDQEI